ncbi:MAG: ribonuclease P protein component 4 [Methanolinea sp.]
MTKRSPRSDARRIARERIAILFARAREVFHAEPHLSDRYISLARRIAMKLRVRLDREYRRQFCHRCYRYLVPGVNARVRIARGKVTVTCLACGHRARFPTRRRC